MNPCAPNVLLFVQHENLAPLADDIEQAFKQLPIWRQGFRLIRFDAQGPQNTSLAAVKDAAGFLLLRQPNGLATGKRSLTESAILQHLSAAGRRQTLPVLDLYLTTKHGKQELPPLDAKLAQNPRYSRQLQDSNTPVSEILQQFQAQLWDQPDDGGSTPAPLHSLLTVWGVHPEQLDEMSDPLEAEQLALIFGCQRDDSEQHRFDYSSDGANLRMHQAWAMKNLDIGHREGALQNLRTMLDLDDGNLTANFWMAKLLCGKGQSPNTLQEAHNRANIARRQIERRYPHYLLLLSLLRLYQSHAQHHLGQLNEALDCAAQSCKLCFNPEAIETLLRRVIQRVVRDGDIRLHKNEVIVDYTIAELERLYANNHLDYYALMRRMGEEFGAEILNQFNQRLVLRLQKTATPIFKSEHHLTLFTAEITAQALMAPRDAKPLPVWQQLEQSRDSLRSQLALVQNSAQALATQEQRLVEQEHQLEVLERANAGLSSRIEERHQGYNAYSNGARSMRNATAIAAIISAALLVMLWYPILPRLWIWGSFAAGFVLTSLLAIQWVKQREKQNEELCYLKQTARELTELLHEGEHQATTAPGLIERLDYLCSRLQETVLQSTNKLRSEQRRWQRAADEWLECLGQFENALSVLETRFLPPEWQSDNGEVRLARRHPDTGATLPAALQQRLGQVNFATQHCLVGVEGAPAAIYFSASNEAVWTRLQAPASLLSKEPDTQVDNVISLRPEGESV